tara:strand:+ start:188 stop:400 length:213 start_codon:yes stop_codon:yes gene_type:complete
MINSDTFGMTFWLDNDNEFCYCPTFVNNQPDKDNWGYVIEWTDWEGVNYEKLFQIYHDLLTTKLKIKEVN